MGVILVTPTSGDLAGALPITSGSTDLQSWLTAGNKTWTKPSWATVVKVIL